MFKFSVNFFRFGGCRESNFGSSNDSSLSVEFEGVSKTGYSGNGVTLQKFHSTVCGIGKTCKKENEYSNG